MNIEVVEDWRTPIIGALKALAQEEIISDKALAKKVVCCILIREDLYKRGFITPLLKCIGKEQAEYVMNKLHNGVCGMCCDHRTLAARSSELSTIGRLSVKIAPNM